MQPPKVAFSQVDRVDVENLFDPKFPRTEVMVKQTFGCGVQRLDGRDPTEPFLIGFVWVRGLRVWWVLRGFEELVGHSDLPNLVRIVIRHWRCPDTSEEKKLRFNFSPYVFNSTPFKMLHPLYTATVYFEVVFIVQSLRI